MSINLCLDERSILTYFGVSVIDDKNFNIFYRVRISLTSKLENLNINLCMVL